MQYKTFIDWHWQPNNELKTPVAVIAWYDTVKQLLFYLLQNSADCDLAQFQFVKGENFIVIIGQSSQLPWVDGVQYAMSDSQEPQLWLPCHVKPSISTTLLSKAISYKFAHQHVLIWDNPRVVIPLDRKWPLTKEFLAYGS